MPAATIRKFRIVQKEGKRHVARMVDFYNLDMIISVGYRVKNRVATRFRIWTRQTGNRRCFSQSHRATVGEFFLPCLNWPKATY